MDLQKPLIIDLLDNGQYQSLLQGQPKTCGMRSGRVYLAPGEDCSEHSTGQREEMLVFLAGNGQAQIEGRLFEVGAGKVVYIPPRLKITDLLLEDRTTFSFEENSFCHVLTR